VKRKKIVKSFKNVVSAMPLILLKKRHTLKKVKFQTEVMSVMVVI
jgi:hypothetical protein